MKKLSAIPLDESAKNNLFCTPPSIPADAAYEMMNTLSVNTTTIASVAQPRRTHFFDRSRVNLESHQLIWCDTNVNSLVRQSESLVTIDKLRQIVDYTKLYDNANECLQYVEQTKDLKTFLVCSEQSAEKLVPQMHEWRNIRSIYIYCLENNESHLEQRLSGQTQVRYILVRSFFVNPNVSLKEVENGSDYCALCFER